MLGTAVALGIASRGSGIGNPGKTFDNEPSSTTLLSGLRKRFDRFRRSLPTRSFLHHAPVGARQRLDRFSLDDDVVSREHRAFLHHAPAASRQANQQVSNKGDSHLYFSPSSTTLLSAREQRIDRFF